MRLRIILAGVAVMAVAFVGATVAMQALMPSAASVPPPALAESPPLPPARGTSVIVAPVDITLAAIRDAIEAHAPRDLTGKRDKPLSKLLSNVDLSWTVTRGPLAVAGQADALVVSTPLDGTLRATGQLSPQAAGGLGNVVGELFGRDAARSVQKYAGKTLDQRADIRGSVAVTSRLAVTPAWRLDPNLSVQVAVAEAAVTLPGVRLSVAKEVKPLLERAVDDQVKALQERLRSDPILETAVRREWAKLCRSFALGKSGGAIPDLWLEFRPVRAIAAQPRMGAGAVRLTVGIEAETRVVPTKTKPECPFPAKLEVTPPTDQGYVKIAVPIDVPFAEINRLMERQLAGKTFPEDKSGPIDMTIRRASVAASGDRLLLSLQVNAKERTSWFGFGTDAMVHVWGRPVLDREQQVLRLADVTLDVRSEGVAGAAVKAGLPYLQRAVAEKAVVDLKPLAANARRSIEAALAEFQTKADGVRVDATATALRLVAIAFDAKTLRVVAEADGTAKVAVTKLPGR
ncbi:MAG: DUF4403 family protein [Xanthobacteraceae bacterium]